MHIKKSVFRRLTCFTLAMGICFCLTACGTSGGEPSTGAEFNLGTPANEQNDTQVGGLPADESSAQKNATIENDPAEENGSTKEKDTAGEDGVAEQPLSDKETEKEGNDMLENGIVEICPEEYTAKTEGRDYGELIKTKYYSTTCEKERPVNIWLPAGYSDAKKYPVLYLLHGIFGSENDMNPCSVAIANMIEKGVAKEMIVVYPYMYASKTKDACTAIDQENIEAYDNFVNDLVDDLMPFIKENYSIAEGRENTAIAGFSMGGRESLAIGLAKPDLVGYIGAISPAPGLVPGKDWATEHVGQFKEEELIFADTVPFLVMICCGDSDKVVGQFPKSYHEIFEKNGTEHIWWEIKGSDHGEPAISSGIYNFCSRIF